MSDVLIDVDHVSKRFCRSLKRSLWYGVRDIVGELAGRSAGARPELRPSEFWAVNDVSLQVRRGECVGLIGPNGAGKSTLLKMINGLIKPDSGRIAIRGRVGALIELGAGFHPVLTGRENIYINGAVLGLSKREIDARLDNILEFAEIGDAINAPVKSYSSGMRVRLGFAVAAHLEPDVLLIDEVLAVGDIGFRAKCYNKMYNLARKATIIFVSHSMNSIDRLCNSVLLLHRGEIISSDTNTGQVIDRYNRLFECNTSSVNKLDDVDYFGYSVNDLQNPETTVSLEYGQPLTVAIDVKVPDRFEDLEISIKFLSQAHELVAFANSHCLGYAVRNNGRRRRYVFHFPECLLGSEMKYLSFSIVDRQYNHIILWCNDVARLQTSNSCFIAAPVCFKGDLQFEDAE